MVENIKEKVEMVYDCPYFLWSMGVKIAENSSIYNFHYFKNLLEQTLNKKNITKKILKEKRSDGMNIERINNKISIPRSTEFFIERGSKRQSSSNPPRNKLPGSHNTSASISESFLFEPLISARIGG